MMHSGAQVRIGQLLHIPHSLYHVTGIAKSLTIVPDQEGHAFCTVMWLTQRSPSHPLNLASESVG